MINPNSFEPDILMPHALEHDKQTPQLELLSHAFQAGELCPSCGQARLDYDGCLNLICPKCNYFAGGGCFT
jgi:hypothetical protein